MARNSPFSGENVVDVVCDEEVDDTVDDHDEGGFSGSQIELDGSLGEIRKNSVVVTTRRQETDEDLDFLGRPSGELCEGSSACDEEDVEDVRPNIRGEERRHHLSFTDHGEAEEDADAENGNHSIAVDGLEGEQNEGDENAAEEHADEHGDEVGGEIGGIGDSHHAERFADLEFLLRHEPGAVGESGWNEGVEQHQHARRREDGAEIDVDEHGPIPGAAIDLLLSRFGSVFVEEERTEKSGDGASGEGSGVGKNRGEGDGVIIHSSFGDGKNSEAVDLVVRAVVREDAGVDDGGSEILSCGVNVLEGECFVCFGIDPSCELIVDGIEVRSSERCFRLAAEEASVRLDVDAIRVAPFIAVCRDDAENENQDTGDATSEDGNNHFRDSSNSISF